MSTFFAGGPRWTRLLPVVFVTYSLAYLDRSNFSIAAAGGMNHELGIGPRTSGLIAAAFFLGYFLCQIPGVLLADRRGVRALIFYSVLAWGLLASLQGFLSSTTVLIVVRFALGAVEAAVLPALVILVSRWFTRGERGTANTILILGNPVTILWLSALSGYLVEATSWRAMFIIEGLPALLWAFCFRHVVGDRPREVSWLSADERERVEETIACEQAQLVAADTTGDAVGAALTHRVTVVFAVQYLLWSIGVYGFVFWLPSIVQGGIATGIGTAGLLSAVPYAIAVLVMVWNSRASDRRGERAAHIWPWLLLGAGAFYGSYALSEHGFWFSFGLLVIAGVSIYAPYGPFFAMIAELVPAKIAAVSIGVVNAFGGLGGFLGTYLVGSLTETTGSTAAAFLLLASTMGASAALMFMLKNSLRKEMQPV